MLLNRRSRASLETALCTGLLALLALLALSPIVRGKTPIAAGGILFEAPWEEGRPAGLTAPAGDDTDVQASRFYPWYAYLSHAARSEDSLLWSPLEGCGMPFLAQWRTRCFSPFSLPFYLFSPAAALRLSIFLKLFVAGWCAFHAARKLGFEYPLALAVGVAFEFSGHVYLWQGWPISDVAPWLPLLLLYVERLLVGHHRYWPFGAVIVALMTLGGDPETLAASLVFVTLYVPIRRVMDRKSLGRMGGGLIVLALTTAMGLALAAFQLVPFVEFIRQAMEANPARSTPIALKDFVVSFLPNFFGSPSAISSQGEAVRSSRVVMLLHFGLIQLWLLPLWFSVRSFVLDDQRRRVEALLANAAVMTALAFAFARYAGGVPLLRYLRPEHLLVGNGLAFALMSVAAADEWLALNADQCKAVLKRLAFWLVVLCATGVTLLVSARGLPRADALPLWAQLLTVAALFIAFAIMLGATLLRPSPWIMGGSLTVLIFVSSAIAFGPGITFTPRDALFPETSFVKTLEATSERIGGSETLKRWPLAGNLIPQVYCPSATQPDGVMLDRYAAFVGRIEADPLLLRRVGAAALLLSKEDIRGAFAPIRPNLAIQHVFPSGAVLFKDLDTKPRARVAYDWRVGETLDPGAITAGLPPIVEGASPPMGPKNGSEAKVVTAPSNGSTRVEIEVDSPLPGMLILADAFYPGWKATVNGEETPILPVDGLFRGVAIKEGKRQVVFSYKPFSVRLGLGISVPAALIALLALYQVVRQRLENRS